MTFAEPGTRDEPDIEVTMTTKSDETQSQSHCGQEGVSLDEAFALWITTDLLPRRLPGGEIPRLKELREVLSLIEQRSGDWATRWVGPERD